MNLLLCIISSLLCTAALGDALQYPYPIVNLQTPEDFTCPPDGVRRAVRMNITSNVSLILQEIAAEFNQTVVEIDQNDTNTHTVPECGGPGWRQVAFLNMTDTNQTCPDSWREYSQNSVRACRRQESGIASCNSVRYSVDGLEYMHVCGRIIGYQLQSPDGYVGQRFTPLTPGNEINEPYVDGVSVTYSNPRQHVWSLFGALYFGECCGTPSSNAQPPSFIGQNYFCDTGNVLSENWVDMFFTSYPLWDNEANCPSDANCCAPQTGPWFNTTLTAPTTGDIEIRICGDQGTSDEDTPLELIEIYVM